jgi:hypothetical protein
MGNYHSEFIQCFFKDNPNGIDLGNIEIKESTLKYHKFTVKQKDMSADYLLFYDHASQIWALAQTKSFPEITQKRSFRLAQVLDNSYFVTKNDFEIMREVHKIIQNPALVTLSKEALEVKE